MDSEAPSVSCPLLRICWMMFWLWGGVGVVCVWGDGRSCSAAAPRFIHSQSNHLLHDAMHIMLTHVQVVPALNASAICGWDVEG